MAGRGKQKLKPEDLEAVASELRKRAAELAGMAKRMKTESRPAIEAMGLPMVDRGIGYVDKFILSCKRDLGGF